MRSSCLSRAPKADIPPGYRIRGRRLGDDPHLLRIENAANRLLADHGYPEIAAQGLPSVSAITAILDAGTVFVAETTDGVPAGYAIVVEIGDLVHLRELSVDPDHGRRGLGSALLEAVVEHARACGAEGVSLSTFRDVPFNAPFYAGRGFAALDPALAPDSLKATLLAEVPPGVAVDQRTLMLRRL